MQVGVIQQGNELIAGVFRSYSWKMRAKAVYLNTITHINFNTKMSAKLAGAAELCDFEVLSPILISFWSNCIW